MKSGVVVDRISLLLHLFLFVSVFGERNDLITYQKQLRDKICKYEDVLPRVNNSYPVKVYVRSVLKQILEVNERSQYVQIRVEWDMR